MIKTEVIDELFNAGVRSCAIFDKRVLLPISQLPEAVAAETGESISAEGLRKSAADGWFPILNGAGFGAAEEGAPLYAPSRIGLLLKLQRHGWAEDELQLVASSEETMIDGCLAADDLAYIDDDLDMLLSFAADRLHAFEDSTGGDPVRQQRELSAARRDLAFLRGLREGGVPDHLKPAIEKGAFRARAFNEFTRVMLLDMDRSKVANGFSPFVTCDSSTWSREQGFAATKINWGATIRAAMAYGEPSAEPPIRLPEFLLRGDLITPTRTLRPAEYATLWNDRDLGTYLKCWGELHGERRCLNCFRPLGSSDGRRKFCTEKCRNAAKQRRFRERNPEAIEQIQKRYWESIDLND